MRSVSTVANDTVQVHRDEVLMYDGNFATVVFECEVEVDHDPGDRWTPPYTAAYVTHVTIIEVDAYDADDNEISVDVNDATDAYVQSAMQHIEENEPDSDEFESLIDDARGY